MLSTIAPATGIVYSVVVPVFNEEAVLPAFYERMAAVFNALDAPAECVFVNDGSIDRTAGVLRDIHSRDPRMKVVSLSRNFGHQIAITAGLDYASGEAIVVIDADLQDPPEVIPRLIEKWKEGYEVVYAVRQQRQGDSFFKRSTASVFYRILRRLTNVDIPMDAGDFRLVGGRAAKALRGMREKHRFVRGMVSWVGFRQTGVEYVRHERHAGETKYPLRKMVRFALDGITSFSTVPLRIASYLGFLGAFICMLYISWVLYLRLVQNITIVGWASLMVAILFLGSVQLITLGILGEYIGRICDEVRGRPLYIVDESCGAFGDRAAESYMAAANQSPRRNR